MLYILCAKFEQTLMTVEYTQPYASELNEPIRTNHFFTLKVKKYLSSFCQIMLLRGNCVMHKYECANLLCQETSWQDYNAFKIVWGDVLSQIIMHSILSGTRHHLDCNAFSPVRIDVLNQTIMTSNLSGERSSVRL